MNPKLYSWHVILNPNALLQRSAAYWDAIENKLKDVGIDYCRHVTPNADEATELIINLCKKGERHFIIVGGDGTLNVFADAVMESQIDSTEIFAALVPLGTGNDWSRSHGYPKNYLDSIDLLIEGNFKDHDVGRVETIINKQVVDTRYFVNIAGFGFDGAVIANANKKRRKFLNEQLYLFNLFKTLISFMPQFITLKSNDYAATKNIFTIAAGIGQYNGNGMRQCPEAITNDGLLDVVMIRKVSFFTVLFHIKKLFNGTHLESLKKDVSTFRTDYLELDSTPFIPGEVDGESLMPGNYRIRCIPSAINFLVSTNTASQ